MKKADNKTERHIAEKKNEKAEQDDEEEEDLK